MTSWHTVLGPQSGQSHQPVHQRHAFLQPEAGLHHRRGHAVRGGCRPRQILPPDVRGGLQGEALTFRDTVSSLTILMVLAVFVMYVILAILYESYLHPITVLSSLPVALVGGLLTLWLFNAEASLYAFIGMFMLMGIVKKNGIMIVDFAQQRVEQGLHGRRSHPRCQHGALPPDHDDHAGGADGRAADRAGFRRGRRFAPAAGTGGRGRADRLAVHHAVRHAGDLSVSRRIPGEGAGSHQLLPLALARMTLQAAGADGGAAYDRCVTLAEYREETRNGGNEPRCTQMDWMDAARRGRRCSLFLSGLHRRAEVSKAVRADAPVAYKELTAQNVSRTQRAGKSRSRATPPFAGKWWEIFGDRQIERPRRAGQRLQPERGRRRGGFLPARALVKQARRSITRPSACNPTHHEFAGALRPRAAGGGSGGSSAGSFLSGSFADLFAAV